MKKHKVLYIHSTAIIPGKANLTQVAQMCNAFLNLSCDLTLAIPKSEVTQKEALNILIQQFSVNPNIKIEFISKFTNIDILNKYSYHLRIKQIVKKVNPDFCYVRNPFFLLSCKWLRVPTVYESHNNLTHEGSKLLNRLISAMLIRLSKSKYTLRFVAISQALANYWLKQGVPSNKIIILHDGFNESYYRAQLDIKSARNSLGITENKKLILYAGSLNPERGIDQLLFVAERLPDCIFYILGGPEKYKDHYKSLAAQKGINNIVFKGFVEHSMIHQYLFAADVLLAIWTRKVKTINYCSPLKLFEYLASGKPIVITGFPTILEVVTDKINAIVVNPECNEDLLNGTKIALSLRENDIGRNARNLAFSKYTWDKRVREILNSIELL